MRRNSVYYKKSIILLGILLLLCSSCSLKPMKSIAEISEEIYPLDFDLELAKEKGIGDKKTYEEVQKNYLVYFSVYLNSLYDFSKVDEELDSKGFKPTTETSYYLERSELGSKYIYLRNNVHCEYLSKEQIQFFINSSGDTSDEEGIKIVKATYSEVLSARSNTFTGEFLLSYTGGSSLRNKVENTSLLFYLSFEDTKSNSKAYLKEWRKESEEINLLSSEIIIELSESILLPIYIFDSGNYGLD